MKDFIVLKKIVATQPARFGGGVIAEIEAYEANIRNFLSSIPNLTITQIQKQAEYLALFKPKVLDEPETTRWPSIKRSLKVSTLKEHYRPAKEDMKLILQKITEGLAVVTEIKSSLKKSQTSSVLNVDISPIQAKYTALSQPEQIRRNIFSTSKPSPLDGYKKSIVPVLNTLIERAALYQSNAEVKELDRLIRKFDEESLSILSPQKIKDIPFVMEQISKIDLIARLGAINDFLLRLDSELSPQMDFYKNKALLFAGRLELVKHIRVCITSPSKLPEKHEFIGFSNKAALNNLQDAFYVALKADQSSLLTSSAMKRRFMTAVMTHQNDMASDISVDRSQITVGSFNDMLKEFQIKVSNEELRNLKEFQRGISPTSVDNLEIANFIRTKVDGLDSTHNDHLLAVITQELGVEMAKSSAHRFLMCRILGQLVGSGVIENIPADLQLSQAERLNIAMQYHYANNGTLLGSDSGIEETKKQAFLIAGLTLEAELRTPSDTPIKGSSVDLEYVRFTESPPPPEKVSLSERLKVFGIKFTAELSQKINEVGSIIQSSIVEDTPQVNILLLKDDKQVAEAIAQMIRGLEVGQCDKILDVIKSEIETSTDRVYRPFLMRILGQLLASGVKYELPESLSTHDRVHIAFQKYYATPVSHGVLRTTEPMEYDGAKRGVLGRRKTVLDEVGQSYIESKAAGSTPAASRRGTGGSPSSSFSTRVDLKSEDSSTNEKQPTAASVLMSHDFQVHSGLPKSRTEVENLQTRMIRSSSFNDLPVRRQLQFGTTPLRDPFEEKKTEELGRRSSVSHRSSPVALESREITIGDLSITVPVDIQSTLLTIDSELPILPLKGKYSSSMLEVQSEVDMSKLPRLQDSLRVAEFIDELGSRVTLGNIANLLTSDDKLTRLIGVRLCGYAGARDSTFVFNESEFSNKEKIHMAYQFFHSSDEADQPKRRFSIKEGGESRAIIGTPVQPQKKDTLCVLSLTWSLGQWNRGVESGIAVISPATDLVNSLVVGLISTGTPVRLLEVSNSAAEEERVSIESDNASGGRSKGLHLQLREHNSYDGAAITQQSAGNGKRNFFGIPNLGIMDGGLFRSMTVAKEKL